MSRKIILSTDAYTKAKWWRPIDACELLADTISHSENVGEWTLEIWAASPRSEEIVAYVLPHAMRSTTGMRTISLDESGETKVDISLTSTTGGWGDEGRAHIHDILSLDRLLVKMFDIYKESHVHKYGDISSDAVIMRMMLLNLKLELFTMK